MRVRAVAASGTLLAQSVVLANGGYSSSLTQDAGVIRAGEEAAGAAAARPAVAGGGGRGRGRRRRWGQRAECGCWVRRGRWRRRWRIRRGGKRGRWSRLRRRRRR